MATAPLDHAKDCLARARAVHTLAASGGLNAQVADDFLRLALVMGVAALDTLMHQLVWRSVQEHETLPAALASFSVPFFRLAGLANEMKRARRAGDTIRPWVSVKTALRSQLAQETFQSSRRVGDAMAMAGMKKGWSNVADEVGEKAEDMKRRLDEIVRRRNGIVHEGDHERRDRPRTVKLVPIDGAAVASDLDWLEQLVDAIAAAAGP